MRGDATVGSRMRGGEVEQMVGLVGWDPAWRNGNSESWGTGMMGMACTGDHRPRRGRVVGWSRTVREDRWDNRHSGHVCTEGWDSVGLWR